MSEFNDFLDYKELSRKGTDDEETNSQGQSSKGNKND